MGEFALFEPDGKDGHICGSDSGDASGLAEGGGTDVGEALACFHFEPGDGVVIEVIGERDILLFGEAFDLLGLALNMPSVFEVAFEDGPMFHVELRLHLLRKVLPVAVSATEPSL